MGTMMNILLQPKLTEKMMKQRVSIIFKVNEIIIRILTYSQNFCFTKLYKSMSSTHGTHIINIKILQTYFFEMNQNWCYNTMSVSMMSFTLSPKAIPNMRQNNIFIFNIIVKSCTV